MTAKLDALGHRTEQLAEQFNKARLDVSTAARAADRSALAAARAASKYHAARVQFAQVITAQYESGSFGAAGALLNSDSGANYLDRLATLDLVSRQQADAVAHLRASKTTVSAARKRADAALRAAQAKRRDVGEQRSRAAAQTAKFEALLATLTARQQQIYATRNDATPAQAKSVAKTVAKTGRSVHAGNAAAQRAVDFALAQVGKPYSFGADGPGSYDCSGLTMAAWRAGGVSLPHVAASQINYGTHVSADQLQPGDLVFFYSPIGHVSMYIGNGMLVSAPQPGENVKVLPFSYVRSDFVGATRLA